ncbi:MAG: Asp-tRNA(Asn)/Glu-tRNA(Gln) amidotransferase GatCAB subunit B, partial [Burkholderiaceae bacterium]|nr:Asp-tRNA(Asn)/Glu-tRNA(Gln) amidotransferase GatCAB subunit B [Burkholderiaceae bacterium]
LVIGRDWVEKTRSEMTELPRVMAARFAADYGLSEYDAGQLTQSKAMAAYFEAVATTSGQPKLASNWVMGELSRRLNAENIDIEHAPVNPAQLASVISHIEKGTISNSGAKQVFDLLWNKPKIETLVAGSFEDMNAITFALIEANGLKQMSDTGELEKIIDDVLAANAKNVEEVRAGNAKAMNALVGQAMKATKGKANPAQVNELLKKKLG